MCERGHNKPIPACFKQSHYHELYCFCISYTSYNILRGSNITCLYCNVTVDVTLSYLFHSENSLNGRKSAELLVFAGCRTAQPVNRCEGYMLGFCGMFAVSIDSLINESDSALIINPAVVTCVWGFIWTSVLNTVGVSWYVLFPECFETQPHDRGSVCQCGLKICL